MTIVLGLRCLEGVVLAADSQRTEGPFREEFPKVFATPSGIVWGTAGSIAIQQELFGAVAALQPTGRLETRDGIVQAIKNARQRIIAPLENPTPAMTSIDGLFAWYAQDERRTFLLRVPTAGPAEFHPLSTAIGGPRGNALFALSGLGHLDYATLRLEAAKVVAFNVADDVIRASQGVGPPVQMGVVTPSKSYVMTPDDVRGVSDTVDAYREYQRDYLKRGGGAASEGGTGLRPPGQ